MKPETCLFCGAHDLAETRIWPAWLERIVPKESYRRIGATSDACADAARQRTDLRASQADRRVACAACNDGWIAALGDEVEGFLAPVLSGQAVALAPAQARTLSAWLCLIGMDAAFLNCNCGISPGDRSYLRHTGHPPRNWIVFVAGMANSAWCGSCSHHPYRIEFAGNPLTTRSRANPILSSNTQLLSFGIGPLFFQVLTSPSFVVQAELTRICRERGLTQLWPQERRFGVLPRPATLPPALRLNEDDAWEIGEACTALVRSHLPAAVAGRVAMPA